MIKFVNILDANVAIRADRIVEFSAVTTPGGQHLLKLEYEGLTGPSTRTFEYKEEEDLMEAYDLILSTLMVDDYGDSDLDSEVFINEEGFVS